MRAQKTWRQQKAHWLAGACALLLTLSLQAADRAGTAGGVEFTDDRAAVQALETDIALILAREGFDQYATHFHPDYSNWSGNGLPMQREEFLSAVKNWYDGGGRATAVSMQPVAIEVWGELALSRYLLREDFADGSSFIGRFVSVARKTDGRWQLYRTSFNTLYRGETKQAPQLASMTRS